MDLSRKTTLEPADRRAEELLAISDDYVKRHKIEQALVTYREALALNPQLLPAQLGLVEGELLAGREGTAAREYERALKLSSGNENALCQLAQIYSHQPRTWSRSEARAASHYRVWEKLLDRGRGVVYRTRDTPARGLAAPRVCRPRCQSMGTVLGEARNAFSRQEQ